MTTAFPNSGDPRELDRLVASALTGERGAMDTLLRILRPLVVRYCRSRLGGYDRRVDATPDDVAQEVCLAVLRALPTYQDQGRPFLAFVYGIAQHKVVDAHRSAGRDRSDPVDELPEEQDVRGGPEQHALNLSESHDMAALLAELPEKQREVLRLRVVVGLTAEETAEVVGSTAGAVRVAQHRGLSRLRQLVVERSDHASPGNAPEEETARRRGGSRGPRRRRAAPGVRPPALPRSTTVQGADGSVDWHAAPRTGRVALDRLLDAADGHLLGQSDSPDWAIAPVTGFEDLDRLLESADQNMQRLLPEHLKGPSIYEEDRIRRAASFGQESTSEAQQDAAPTNRWYRSG